MLSQLTQLVARFHAFIHTEVGQDLVEYALTVALVAFGATAALQSVGSGLNSAFTNISSTLASSLT
jgi:pilus assembly protein Flp/PilA